MDFVFDASTPPFEGALEAFRRRSRLTTAPSADSEVHVRTIRAILNTMDYKPMRISTTFRHFLYTELFLYISAMITAKIDSSLLKDKFRDVAIQKALDCYLDALVRKLAYEGSSEAQRLLETVPVFLAAFDISPREGPLPLLETKPTALDRNDDTFPFHELPYHLVCEHIAPKLGHGGDVPFHPALIPPLLDAGWWPWNQARLEYIKGFAEHLRRRDGGGHWTQTLVAALETYKTTSQRFPRDLKTIEPEELMWPPDLETKSSKAIFQPHDDAEDKKVLQPTDRHIGYGFVGLERFVKPPRHTFVTAQQLTDTAYQYAPPTLKILLRMTELWWQPGTREGLVCVGEFPLACLRSHGMSAAPCTCPAERNLSAHISLLRHSDTIEDPEVKEYLCSLLAKPSIPTCTCKRWVEDILHPRERDSFNKVHLFMLGSEGPRIEELCQRIKTIVGTSLILHFHPSPCPTLETVFDRFACDVLRVAFTVHTEDRLCRAHIDARAVEAVRDGTVRVDTLREPTPFYVQQLLRCDSLGFRLATPVPLVQTYKAPIDPVSYQHAQWMKRVWLPVTPPLAQIIDLVEYMPSADFVEENELIVRKRSHVALWIRPSEALLDLSKKSQTVIHQEIAQWADENDIPSDDEW